MSWPLPPLLRWAAMNTRTMPNAQYRHLPNRSLPSAPCYHGGAFFEAIGVRFDDLTRAQTVINADVLDAWFPPAPSVLEAITTHLSWMLRTSPPTACEGVLAALAESRGVTPLNLLPGAGSSDLMFRVLPRWLTPQSRVLLLDPTYGEYAHLFEKVIGCHVQRLPLCRGQDFAVPLRELASALREPRDLVVLVNPNSPTGQFLPRAELKILLRGVPPATRVWVDETYLEYVGADQSCEPLAASSSNIFVCKSLSKVYALSGVRAAYLCGASSEIETLRAFTPPWALSLPAQIAVVRALQSQAYYEARWNETHHLRQQLQADLEALGWDVIPGCANFLLCHLPDHQPEAEILILQCRQHHLYLRNAAPMSQHLGSRALRITVKDAATNARMLEILTAVLAADQRPESPRPSAAPTQTSR